MTAPYSGERLRSYIERLERLEEEKAAMAADIKEVYAEAKACGFDTKTMRRIISLRKMDPLEREEHEALIDIYKGALGMLGDTPLGEAARRRLDGRKPKADPQPDIEDEIEEAAEREAEAEAPPKETTLEEARAMGAQAARDDKPVTANPFPARDPRRAAWDEAWCFAAGSDGMDIPAAWRRSKPKKKGDPPPETDGEDDRPDDDDNGEGE